MECHSTKLKACLLTIAGHELVQCGQVLSKPFVSLQSQFLLAEIPYIYCAVFLNIEDGPHCILFLLQEGAMRLKGADSHVDMPECRLNT